MHPLFKPSSARARGPLKSATLSPKASPMASAFFHQVLELSTVTRKGRGYNHLKGIRHGLFEGKSSPNPTIERMANSVLVRY